jgi:hypothetical protein
MPGFEQIKPGVRLRGLDPAGIAEVVSVSHFGTDALNLVFRVDGRVGERLVYRGEESGFEFLEAGRNYGFDADGGLLRLASEAYRIRLAYLFDPYLAVSASQIEALPHQITAVYGEMLPRQPLRFLLADDPGAGKTIMAGLLIKELMIRGDLERCLIMAPGGLVEQWQDELSEKFGLAFDILTRDQIEASVTGNPFTEKHRLIVRLDMAARSEELKAKLQASPDWDLVICDEAHRMAASYFGGEVKETQRYKLGKLLGTRTRNLLLMSATPTSFFGITFLTEGLKRVLTSAAQRLADKGGDPVIGLQTAFGGGKTHTMLAIFHLAKHLADGGDPSALPGLGSVLEKASIAALPKPKLAVFVGSADGPDVSLKIDKGPRLHTVWGYLAWRLAGDKGTCDRR